MTRHLDLSDEKPSNRADVFALREDTGLTFEWQIGLAKIKASANTEAQPTSPTAIGISMMLLAAGSSIPVVLFTMAGWIVHAPAALTAVCSALGFFTVFATGVLLVLRGDLALSRQD